MAANFSAVEIHANAIDDILTGDFIQRPGATCLLELGSRCASVGRRTIAQRAGAVETAEDQSRGITANVVGTNIRGNFRWRDLESVDLQLSRFRALS